MFATQSEGDPGKVPRRERKTKQKNNGNVPKNNGKVPQNNGINGKVNGEQRNVPGRPTRINTIQQKDNNGALANGGPINGRKYMSLSFFLI